MSDRTPAELAREVRQYLHFNDGAFAALAELEAQAEAGQPDQDFTAVHTSHLARGYAAIEEQRLHELACAGDAHDRDATFHRHRAAGLGIALDLLDAAAVPSPADQEPDIAFERSLLRADIRAGNTEAAELQRDRIIQAEQEEAHE